MFRQVGIGAAAVLTVGLLAVGCSEEGDTIVTGGGGTDLNSNDAFNASSVLSNNVAADGGGFSPDNENLNVNDIQVRWACDASESDGTYGGDGSAMILFQTNTSGRSRVYAIHCNGSTLTPPTELKLPDRDETQGVTVNAAVMLYVATANYAGATGSTQQANDARGNDGNWYILLDYVTFFDDPVLGLQQPAAGSNARGEHRALGFVVFVKSLRDSGTTTSDKVGGVAQTFVNGFQDFGTQVELARGGAVAANISIPGSTIPAPGRATPASNVQSFGFVTDGFSGQASFGGTGTPLRPATAGQADYDRAEPVSGNPTGAAYDCGERTNFIGLVYTQIVNSFSTGGAGTTGTGFLGAVGVPAGEGQGGEDLKMFFHSINLTNNTIENLNAPQEIDPPAARNPNTGALSAGTGFYPEFYTYNQFVFVKYADASMNAQFGTFFVDPLDMTDDFHGLGAGTDGQDWDQAQTGGHEGRQISTVNPTWYEDITARFTVVDDGDGTCSITLNGGAELRDNSLFGTEDSHDIANPTINLGTTNGVTVPDLYPSNREMQNYNAAGQFVFGADEGMLDTVVFYTSSPNSNSTLTGTPGAANIDRELLAIGLAADGTQLAPAANNPIRLSRHEVDFHTRGNATTSNQGEGGQANAVGIAGVLRDPLLSLTGGNNRDGQISGNGEGDLATQNDSFFRAAIARTGEYVMVGYLQDLGTSMTSVVGAGGFRTSLMAVAYQAQRSTTGQTTTAVPFDIRFSAPSEVSTSEPVVLPTARFQQLAGPGALANNDSFVQFAERRESWSSLPVNNFKFQDCLGYHCGLQGNHLIMSMIYEQSDSTEDRLKARQVQVTLGGTGTPTLTLGNTVEFDSGEAVPGSENFNDNDSQPITSSPVRTTFRFINGDLRNLDVFAGDLGEDADAQNVTATDGGLFVVYAKTIDNTTSDGDLADAAVVAVQWTGGTSIGAADRVVINNNVNENATPNNQQDANNANANGDVGVGTAPGGSTNGDMNFGQTAAAGVGDFRTGVDDVLCIGESHDITSNNGNNGADAHYIYFFDPRSDNVSSGRALFTRKHDASIRANTQLLTNNPDLGDRLIPAADTGPGSAGFLPPTRLDHLQGSDVFTVNAENSGTSAGVFFVQDGHLWAQLTTDGVTYLTLNGSPNPALVDNDTTGDLANNAAYDVELCDNGDCTARNGMVIFVKIDTDGDQRGRMRIGRLLQ